MDTAVWNRIEQVMRDLDPDPDHALQVARLCRCLSKDLHPVLPLTSDEKELLTAAALLHDIGWSQPVRAHHKASRDIILTDQSIPFSLHERMVVAQIARYHRKAEPAPRHPGYADLNPADQCLVQKAAAILRCADALDRSHLSLVRELSARVVTDVIILTAVTSGQLESEMMVFSEKSSLLSSLSGMLVQLREVQVC